MLRIGFLSILITVNTYFKTEAPSITTIPFTSTEGSGTGNAIRSTGTGNSIRDFLAHRGEGIHIFVFYPFNFF